MSDLNLEKSLPLDESYKRVIEDLHKWYTNILADVDEMQDTILSDMQNTYELVQYFISLTKSLLIEHESRLEKATSNDEIDIIEKRINSILSEVEFLQSLSFHLNCDSVELNGNLNITLNDVDIKSNNSLINVLPNLYNACLTLSKSSKSQKNKKKTALVNTTYRFLITRIDALELERKNLSLFHLTPLTKESIDECVLTFNVFSLKSFIGAFTSFWDLFPNRDEIRVLIRSDYMSYLLDESNKTFPTLENSFKFGQIKPFLSLCPKSDERILLIQGIRHDLMRNCIEELYLKLEKCTKNDDRKQAIKLYNPSNLTDDDINDIMMSNLDYGGFIQNQNKLIGKDSSETCTSGDEDSDNDSPDENNEWWDCRNTPRKTTEIVHREMTINARHPGIIKVVNETCIKRTQRRTGAHVCISGKNDNLQRIIAMTGTREQVDKASSFIQNRIERYISNNTSMKQQQDNIKCKEK